MAVLMWKPVRECEHLSKKGAESVPILLTYSGLSSESSRKSLKLFLENTLWSSLRKINQLFFFFFFFEHCLLPFKLEWLYVCMNVHVSTHAGGVQRSTFTCFPLDFHLSGRVCHWILNFQVILHWLGSKLQGPGGWQIFSMGTVDKTQVLLLVKKVLSKWAIAPSCSTVGFFKGCMQKCILHYSFALCEFFVRQQL